MRDAGGDDWKVVVSSSLGLTDYHSGSVEDHGNGTYTATVTPLVSGPNDLSISLDGSPLKASPFRMDVVHGQVVGVSSYVVQEEDVNTMVAITENMVLIQTTDGNGNDAVFCNIHPFSAPMSW